MSSFSEEQLPAIKQEENPTPPVIRLTAEELERRRVKSEAMEAAEAQAAEYNNNTGMGSSGNRDLPTEAGGGQEEETMEPPNKRRRLAEQETADSDKEEVATTNNNAERLKKELAECKERLKELEELLRDNHQKQQEEYRERNKELMTLEHCQQDNRNLQERVQELETMLQTKDGQLRQKDIAIDNGKHDLDQQRMEWKDEMGKVVGENEELQAEVERLKRKNEEQEKELLREIDRRSDVSRYRFAAENQVVELQDQNNSLREEYEEAQEAMQDFQKLREENERLQKEKQEVYDKNNTLIDEYNGLQPKITKLISEVSDMRLYLAQAEAEMETARKKDRLEIQNLKTERDAALSKSGRMGQYREAKMKIETLNDHVADLKKKLEEEMTKHEQDKVMMQVYKTEYDAARERLTDRDAAIRSLARMVAAHVKGSKDDQQLANRNATIWNLVRIMLQRTSGGQGTNNEQQQLADRDSTIRCLTDIVARQELLAGVGGDSSESDEEEGDDDDDGAENVRKNPPASRSGRPDRNEDDSFESDEEEDTTRKVLHSTRTTTTTRSDGSEGNDDGAADEDFSAGVFDKKQASKGRRQRQRGRAKRPTSSDYIEGKGRDKARSIRSTAFGFPRRAHANEEESDQDFGGNTAGSDTDEESTSRRQRVASERRKEEAVRELCAASASTQACDDPVDTSFKYDLSWDLKIIVPNFWDIVDNPKIGSVGWTDATVQGTTVPAFQVTNKQAFVDLVLKKSKGVSLKATDAKTFQNFSRSFSRLGFKGLGNQTWYHKKGLFNPDNKDDVMSMKKNR